MALVNELYGEYLTPVDYDNIPSAVFSQPNVGTVGLTEAEALMRYVDIEIYKTEFTPMKHTLSGLTEKVMMKMVVRRSNEPMLVKSSKAWLSRSVDCVSNGVARG